MLKFLLIKICLTYLLINEVLSEEEIANYLHTQDVDKTVNYNTYLESIDDVNKSEFIYAESAQKKEVHCNESKFCQNGGSCLQHSCLCLPGTSGPFCEIIDDCKNERLCKTDRYTSCAYSVVDQKAYCHCRIMEYQFDEATRTCRSCDCEPDYYKRGSFSRCEYKQGQQICACTDGYAPIYSPYEKSVICQRCDCGPHSTWCKFRNLWYTSCECEEGYMQFAGDCRECDCGKHGKCSFNGPRYKNCYCDPGYQEFNETCIECNCGKHGKCVFDSDGKQTACECIPGYEDKLGKCEMCYCGENSNCTFYGDRKVCQCQEGFESVNGFCTDINECEKHDPCNSTTRCINTLGSFKCVCGKGYRQNYDTLLCEDVDECKILTTCTQPNTECVNTIGSFKCICEPDFVARGGTNSNIFCERSAEKSIYTMAVTAFVVVIVIAFAVIYRQRSHLQRR